jgi:hypothetical protein
MERRMSPEEKVARLLVELEALALELGWRWDEEGEQWVIPE